MRVLDLTLPVGPGTWTYPGDPKPRVEVNHVGEYRVERVCMGSHTGTHVDAPAHFLPEGVSVDRIEASRLVAPGVAIRIRRGEMGVIDAGDIREALGGQDLRGRYLLIDTGWSRVWGEARARHPYLTREAAEYIVKAGALGLGVDMPSPDHEPYMVHKILLSHGVVIVENLLEPGRLAGERFTLVVAPIPLEGAGGAPARVYAIIW